VVSALMLFLEQDAVAQRTSTGILQKVCALKERSVVLRVMAGCPPPSGGVRLR
jgi:hypothetical protein